MLNTMKSHQEMKRQAVSFGGMVRQKRFCNITKCSGKRLVGYRIRSRNVCILCIVCKRLYLIPATAASYLFRVTVELLGNYCFFLVSWVTSMLLVPSTTFPVFLMLIRSMQQCERDKGYLTNDSYDAENPNKRRADFISLAHCGAMCNKPTALDLE